MKTSKIFALVTVLLLIVFTGCKPNDGDIQAKINDQLKESPELAGVSATVENGTATLTGMVQNESAKSDAAAIAKNVSGVDSVINNITAETPPSPSSSLIKDDNLMESANLILVNFPGVTGSVSAGVITLTGTIDPEKKSALMDTLKTLHPTGINDQLANK